VSYVLSVIMPPVAPAAFGQAIVTEPVIGEQYAADAAGDVLIDMGVRTLEARTFGIYLAGADVGTNVTHRPSALVFRIDPADQAPHPCPCCGRLVLPEDHADAHLDDAYCLGCFTWDRNVPACQPGLTAHTEEP